MRRSMRRGATLGAVALTTLGLAATAGASPTCADSSSCWSWRMRASRLPCSSLAAW